MEKNVWLLSYSYISQFQHPQILNVNKEAPTLKRKLGGGIVIIDKSLHGVTKRVCKIFKHKPIEICGSEIKLITNHLLNTLLQKCIFLRITLLFCNVNI